MIQKTNTIDTCFNPRPSCEGRRLHLLVNLANCGFNPRPSCEGRLKRPHANRRLSLFQSTPLMRGATSVGRAPPTLSRCFNPRPSCEGRPHGYIHLRVVVPRFNPRPSCEGRLTATANLVFPYLFQSTPLMRGATAIYCTAINSNHNIFLPST